MLSVFYAMCLVEAGNAGCHYAEYRHAGCRYADCRHDGVMAPQCVANFYRYLGLSDKNGQKGKKATGIIEVLGVLEPKIIGPLVLEMIGI